MKAFHALLFSLIAATTSFAQENGDSSVLTPVERELVSICQELQSSFDAYYTQAGMLKDDAERKNYLAEEDPTQQFVDQLKEFAQKYHRTHAGLMALRRLVLLGGSGGQHNNPRDLGKRFALSRLTDYERSPELPEVMRYLDSGNTEPEVEAFLQEAIESKAASDVNRVFARYMLARWKLELVSGHEFWERRLKELDAGAESTSPIKREWLQKSLSGAMPSQKLAIMEREAISSLESLSKSQSDVRQPGIKAVDSGSVIVRVDSEITQTMPLVTDLAAGLLFKHKHLQIGRPAADLDVSLVSGESWSLARQRGKTVIIQFSFKGCGPCAAMYPDLKALKHAFPDSLSILSIMADEDQSDTVEAVKSGKLTWNVCWDGSRGQIASQWGVSEFPTVYVVGPNGKIAAVSLYGDPLKAKINELTNSNQR